jgi:hypothetical protein
MALPITILYSSVATRAVVGALCRGASGSAEVFGVGCAVAVSFIVGRHREGLFAGASSSSWAAVVAWCECIRLSTGDASRGHRGVGRQAVGDVGSVIS